MANFNQISIRRGQLISPFGVGAIHVLPGNVAVVTAGLDQWYRSADDPTQRADESQVAPHRIQERRLEERLGVSHFRLPPGPESEIVKNPRLLLPLYRFPSWYICSEYDCHKMEQRSLSIEGEVRCSRLSCRGRMVQVRFAAVCDHGHLQDFPWMEWVHREINPSCAAHNHLIYRSGGAGSLADITVECATCKKKRNLANIMSGKLPTYDSQRREQVEGSSKLSDLLLSRSDNADSTATERFLCEGGLVWHGVRRSHGCQRPLRAILINATNVHYASIHSALWLPDLNVPGTIAELKMVVDKPEIRSRAKILKKVVDDPETIASQLKQTFSSDLGNYEISMIVKALGGRNTKEKIPVPEDELGRDLAIRIPEYKIMQKEIVSQCSDEELEIRKSDISRLPNWLKDKVKTVMLVDKLRETRAMTGFRRLIYDGPDQGIPSERLMWNIPPKDFAEKWLPASVVYGEGIFIAFKEDSVEHWEQLLSDDVTMSRMQSREDEAAAGMGREPRLLHPRFIMLHTLAHLLMVELSFECGYNTASLRERLYSSSHPNNPMAGMLIYTASGDCEGSMGGLVRMGEPGNLARIFENALYKAKWCSSDPVCAESNLGSGQGISGLNGAACHCCTLVPETSCEHFNTYLDRSIVVETSSGCSNPFFKAF